MVLRFGFGFWALRVGFNSVGFVGLLDFRFVF